MRNKNVLAFASAMLLFSLVILPASLALGPIKLSVDPKSGTFNTEYTFTVVWDRQLAPSFSPTFEDVEIQWKRSTETESQWKTYKILGTSDWSGAMESTQTFIQRRFDLTPSAISGIGNTGSYNFRVLDYNYVSVQPDSNVLTLTFGNCVRKAETSIVAVPGKDYTLVEAGNRLYNSGADVYVSVDEGDDLGSGTKVLYDLTVTNRDSGCGSAGSYRLSVLGPGVDRDEHSGRADEYNYEVVGLAAPNDFTLDSGKSRTLRVEVDAASDIGSKTKPEGIVTFRLVDPSTSVLISDTSSKIVVSTIRDCVKNDPTISFEPRLRSGFRNDEVEYLVKITNEDQGGCSPERIGISHVGVQALDQQNSGGRVSTITDENSKRWQFTSRYQSGSAIKETSFNNTGGTFKFIVGDYASYSPSSGISFLLGSSDDFKLGTRECKSCVKQIVLRVRSYGLDTGYGPRSLALCVDHRSVCNAGIYSLLETGTKPTSASDAGIKISDSTLNTPEASPTSVTTKPPVVTTPKPTTPTTTTSTGLLGGKGKTINSVPGIDDSFFRSCKACTLQSKKGWKTATSECVDGTFDGSTDGKASRIAANWIFFPLERAKLQVVEVGARRSNSYSCERPPTGIGRASATSSGTAGAGLVSAAGELASASSGGYQISFGIDKTAYKLGDNIKIDGFVSPSTNDFVTAQLFNPDGSFVSINQVTESSGSFSTTLSIPKTGNLGAWKAKLTYAGKVSAEKTLTVSLDGAASSSTNTPSSTTTTTSSSTSDPCLACVKQFGKGFNTDTKKCESGGAKASSESSASVSNRNWVYFSQDSIRDGAAVANPSLYAGTYSCQNPPSGSSSSGSAASNTGSSSESSSNPCLACVKQFGKGYVTTTGKCESGSAKSSSESSASVSNKNWVYFSQDSIRDGAAVANPSSYAGTYSCQTPPSGSSPSTSSESGTTGVGLTCLECVKQFGKGYVTTTGKCESGSAKTSSESSASVTNRNWVYFSQEAIRDGAAKANPSLYAGTYSCEKLP